MYSALSTLNTTTEVPLSKAPNPQLLPGRCSINGFPLLRVCVHSLCVFTAVVCTLDGINAEHRAEGLRFQGNGWLSPHLWLFHCGRLGLSVCSGLWRLLHADWGRWLAKLWSGRRLLFWVQGTHHHQVGRH